MRGAADGPHWPHEVSIRVRVQKRPRTCKATSSRGVKEKNASDTSATRAWSSVWGWQACCWEVGSSEAKSSKDGGRRDKRRREEEGVWLQGMTQRGVFEEQHVTDYLLGLLLRTTLRHKHMHYTRRPHAQNLSHTVTLSLSLVHTHTHPSHTHTQT